MRWMCSTFWASTMAVRQRGFIRGGSHVKFHNVNGPPPPLPGQAIFINSFVLRTRSMTDNSVLGFRHDVTSFINKK